MEAHDFKKILKPLIKQTVREVILEDGILSNIVAEVARGLRSDMIVEARDNKKTSNQEEKESARLKSQKQERVKKLNESNKIGNYFSGTEEIKEDSQGPLSGVSPGDSGVDISAIQKIASGKWKQLLG